MYAKIIIGHNFREVLAGRNMPHFPFFQVMQRPLQFVLLLLFPAARISLAMDLDQAVANGLFMDISKFQDATDYLTYSGASSFSARYLSNVDLNRREQPEEVVAVNDPSLKQREEFSSHTVHFQISRSVCSPETFASDFNYELSLAILKYKTGEEQLTGRSGNVSARELEGEYPYHSQISVDVVTDGGRKTAYNVSLERRNPDYPNLVRNNHLFRTWPFGGMFGSDR